MTFVKGDTVTFVSHGFHLAGTVIRTRKSDGMVTVNAPVVIRRLNALPVMDTRETMLWDIAPSALTHVTDSRGSRND